MIIRVNGHPRTKPISMDRVKSVLARLGVL